MKTKSLPAILMAALIAAGLARVFGGTKADAGPAPTDGWKEIPFTYEIQHPYDLKTSDRYDFDPTNNVHHFWVYFTDKPHAPPPNKTNARCEMRLQAATNGVYMFDGDVFINHGTFACVGQVLDAAHGPVAMIIAHPDGTITAQTHDNPLINDLLNTNAIGHWWNLKMQNDISDGGQIKIYVDNILKGAYPNRGPREYYFKCGVYSRENSHLSEVRYRNLKLWTKSDTKITSIQKP